MDSVQELSRTLATFVHLFAQINYLFCHLRWLERNIRNASSPLLLMVSLIAICAIFLLTYDNPQARELYHSFGLSDGTLNLLKGITPILLIGFIIGYFCYLRYSQGRTGRNNGYDQVMFGDEESAREGEERGYVSYVPSANKEPPMPLNAKANYSGTSNSRHYVNPSFIRYQDGIEMQPTR